MWLAVDPYFEKNYASEVWYEKRAAAKMVLIHKKNDNNKMKL